MNDNILITTIKEDGYPRPTQRDGQWVVSASAINREPNKAILFDTKTALYTDISPSAVSQDYFTQVKKYETRLSQIDQQAQAKVKGFADTTNPNEANSFADIVTAGSDKVYNTYGVAQIIKDLEDKEYKSALKSWWDVSFTKSLGAKAEATVDLFKDFVIEPLVKKDLEIDEQGNLVELDASIGDKGAALFNNALINLGETMDLVTGANAVKGFIQGTMNGGVAQGVQNVRSGMGDIYGAGRKQFDWNFNKTGTVLDTAVNVALELVSDPTNWISFGAATAIKQVGKASFGDVIAKSAQDVGIGLTKVQADDLADAAIKTFIHKDYSALESIRKTNLTNVLANPITKEQAGAFFEAVQKNADLIKDAHTLNVLKSVRTNIDALQSAAMKAVGATSMLGIGAGAVKGLYKGFKLGVDGLPYVIAKLNNLSGKTNIKDLNTMNFAEFTKEAEASLNTMSELFGWEKEYPAILLRRATENFQRNKFADIQKIISTNEDEIVRLRELNKFAIAEGFPDIDVMVKELISKETIVSEGLVSMAKELENEMYKAIRAGFNSLFSQIRDGIAPDNIFRGEPELIEGVAKAVRQLYQMNFLKAHVSNEMVEAVYGLLNDTRAFRLAARFSQLYDNAVNVGLFNEDLFRLFNLTITQNDATKYFAVISTLKKRVGKTVGLLSLNTLEEAITAMLTGKETSDLIRAARSAQHSVKTTLLEFINKNIPYALNKEAMEDLWHSISSRRDLLTDMRVVMSNAINSLNQIYAPVPTTGIRTVVSDLTNKAINDVHDALFRAFEKQGLPVSKLKETIVQLSKIDLGEGFTTKATEETYLYMEQVIDMLSDMSGLTYFFDSELVKGIMDEWDHSGFSIDIGNELLAALDELLNKLPTAPGINKDMTHFVPNGAELNKATAHYEYDMTELQPVMGNDGKFYYKQHDKVLVSPKYNTKEGNGDIVGTVQNLRDELQALVDSLLSGTELTSKIPAKALLSKLYTLKVSHIGAVTQLLSAKYVEETFDKIYRNLGVGSFIDVLADYGTEDGITKAVQELQSVSKSIFVAKKMINAIKESSFPAEWKEGLYDTLAGFTRTHIKNIYDVESFAHVMLSKGGSFINNKNNAHPARLHDLSPTRDIMQEAQELYRHAFTDFEVSDELTQRWKPVYEALNKEDDNKFNIIYSASQTAVDAGQIFEFAFILPDGTYAMYADKNVRNGVLNTLDDDTAKSLYGKSAKKAKQDIIDNMAKHQGQAYYKEFDSTEDFAKAIYNILDGAKTVARETNLVPRLVGYNTAMDALGTDHMLSDFVYKNMLNARIIHNESLFNSVLAIETLDAAQYIRIAYDGAITYTDTMRQELVHILTGIKDDLDRANLGETLSKTYLMPDFTRGTTSAMRDVLASIRNAQDIMRVEQIGKTAPDSAFVAITKDQYNALRSIYALEDLQVYEEEITNVLKSLGDTMLGIKQTNQVLSQTILIQDALSKTLGEPNIMQILNKYLVEGPGVPALALKTYYNPDVAKNWFNKIPDDADTVRTINNVATHMQDQLVRIKHPMLVLSQPNFELTRLAERLRQMFKEAPRTYSAWNEIVLRLKTGDSKLQNYLVAKQMWDSIRRISKPDYQDYLKKLLFSEFENSPIVGYVINAEETVMYNKPLYIPGLSVLHSSQIEDSNEVFQQIKEIADVINDVATQETLKDMIDLDNAIREASNHNLPSAKVKEPITMAYFNFIQTVKGEISNAFDQYTMAADSTDDVDTLFELRKAYSDRVKGVIEELKTIAEHHAINRVQTIISLPIKDYILYLYKYAQGVQIINLNADVFTKDNTAIQEALGKFMHGLDEAWEFGIETIENKAKGELYVFLNSKRVNLDELEEAAKNFALPEAKIITKSDHSIGAEYGKLVNLLNEWSGNSYNLSNHRAMNQYLYDELLEYLPEGVKNNLINKDYLEDKELLTGQFAQTMLGDYGDGVGTVFSAYSTNLVTNVAAGFNTVFNRLKGKELYKTLFFNRYNTLRYWIDSVHRFNNVDYAKDYKDVLDAITSRNMVIAKIDEVKGVVPVSINTFKKYMHAINSGAVLLDYHSYTRAIEVLNDNKINSRLLNALNKNYLTPLKVGALLSTGFLMRNIPDSTIKGWVQAGLDPAYMVSLFTKTQHYIKQYDYTYRLIFEYSNATLSPENVAGFYKELEEYLSGTKTGLIADLNKRAKLFKNLQKEEVLSEPIFRKMLSFYNSTSATATPAQLDLYKNLEQNLYQKIKGNPNVKQRDVEVAVRIFTKYPNVLTAKAKLIELYPEDVVTDLMLLRRYITKKDIQESTLDNMLNWFTPTKKLMDANTNFESTIRMHTFLYHSVYTNGSMSDAWKMVDKSQFNRSYDTKANKVLEMLMPFSSFQMDNFFFWTDNARRSKGNAIAVAEDVLSGWYNEEQIDPEELSRNMSLQYLFESGNLILNDESGSVLKVNDSVHNVIQLVTNPISTFANMLNVPVKVALELVEAINADPEAWTEDAFRNPKPYKEYSTKDKVDLYAQLLPVVGVMYQRAKTAWTKGKLEASDLILPMLMPSVFGVAKLDSAGTTYQSRPIGTDWYNRDEAYKDTHRYVYGVSYVPAWMSKDPQTYVNTWQRLLDLGYSEDMAGMMMRTGWYFDMEDNYLLKQYSPYIKKNYTKKQFRTYVRMPKKVRNVFTKNFGNGSFSGERIRVTRNYKYRRVYRTRMYSDLYTRTGVPRETLIHWRGANRSSRQLIIDRSNARRMRTKRIIRQVLGR